MTMMKALTYEIHLHIRCISRLWERLSSYMKFIGLRARSQGQKWSQMPVHPLIICRRQFLSQRPRRASGHTLH